MIQRKLLIMNGLYSMVLLGGDLKPILGLWFQLLSMALPREIAVGVENNGIYATCLSQSRTITDACGTLLEIQGFESLPHRSFLAKSPSNSTDYAGEPSRDRSED